MFISEFRAIEFAQKTKKQQKAHHALRPRQSQECNKYVLKHFLVQLRRQLHKSIFGGGAWGELVAVGASGGKMLMAFGRDKNKRKSGQIKSALSYSGKLVMPGILGVSVKSL